MSDFSELRSLPAEIWVEIFSFKKGFWQISKIFVGFFVVVVVFMTNN